MLRLGLTGKIILLFALLSLTAAAGLVSAIRGLDEVRGIDEEAIEALDLANAAALLANRVTYASMLSRLNADADRRQMDAALDQLDGAV